MGLVKKFSGGPAWTRTRDLFLIREARLFSDVFPSLQIPCKCPNYLLDPFLELSGHLLGLLHGCCTRLRRLLRRIGASKEQKYPIRALLLACCPRAPRISNLHDIAYLSTRTTCGGEI